MKTILVGAVAIFAFIERFCNIMRWGRPMRNLFFASAAALILNGCITAEEARVQAQSAQALITPDVIKQCESFILERNPKMTLEGPFFLAAPARREQLFGLDDHKVLLAVPESNVGAFGVTRKGYIACYYEFRDNRLEFQNKIFFYQNLIRRPG